MATKADSIREGTYDAFIRVLDATGGYPITREDIIYAIRDGARRALAEYLEAHGLSEADVEPDSTHAET